MQEKYCCLSGKILDAGFRTPSGKYIHYQEETTPCRKNTAVCPGRYLTRIFGHLQEYTYTIRRKLLHAGKILLSVREDT